MEICKPTPNTVAARRRFLFIGLAMGLAASLVFFVLSRSWALHAALIIAWLPGLWLALRLCPAASPTDMDGDLLKAVKPLSDLLTTGADTSRVLIELCRITAEQTNASLAAIWTPDPSGAVRLEAQYPKPKPYTSPEPRETADTDPVDQPVVQLCITSRRIIECVEPFADADIGNLVTDGTGYVLLVPIETSPDSMSVLALGAASRESLSPALLPVLATFVGVVMAAIRRPIPEEALSGELRKVKIVSSIMCEVGPQAGLADVRAAVVRTGSQVLGTDLVALFTIDPCMGDIECERADGIGAAMQAAFLEVAGGVITDRNWREPRVFHAGSEKDDFSRVLTEIGIQSLLCCPIRSEVGANGAIVAFYPSKDCKDEAAHLIEAIALQASAMISYNLAMEQSRHLLDDLAGVNQELSVQATMDGLTGLANHRTLQQTLNELCRPRSRRSQRVFSLVMIDVDHFKIYNDTYGHQEGDVVLRQVAKVLASKLRQGDLAARYGGEEFALLLRGISKDDARAVADRIRVAVSKLVLDKGSVTVSMGVAEYPADGDTPGEVIERADRALYHSKITGRNRVVVWGKTGCGQSDSETEAAENVGPHKTVLIMERADAEDCGVMRETLAGNSFLVDVVNSPNDAAEFLRTRLFDVALVSIDALPNSEMKPLGTLAAIHPAMPIILVTPSLHVEAAREALRRGASDILLRPYNPAELPLLIERNLERRRLERQRLTQKSTGLLLQAIDALVSAIDAKDHYTAGHSQQVTALALGMADELKIPQEERSALELAARLHDVGKLALPDSALNKQSPLTEEEWAAMREHPALGSKIVGAIDELAYVSTIIRHHHERLDGTGYPDGLRGPAIPFPARIIAVVDAYEAMTSERSYRSRLTPREAIDELRRHSGSFYSAEIVKALEQKLAASGEIDSLSEERAA
ncbi:MAG: diguanylate cyclase [Armatimonadetes bacterium]|nr:diguanylate cyclase [Armatimonadota bacterium]